jgi:DNA repair exonuclease SbcCD nuclease subunit
MDEYRFVHAADLHLDAPFAGIGLTSPSVSATLRDASVRAWHALVRLTIESRAACLLLSGGLYDGPGTGLRAPLSLRAGLQTLADRQIPVFIVLGERDPIDLQSSLSDWPANVTVFDATGTSVPLLRDGAQLAVIHGMSHAAEDAVERLHRTFGAAHSSALHICVLHCAVGSDGDDTGPCVRLPTAELGRLPAGYWALGHERARRYVSEDPWIVYPGTPQSRLASPDADAGGAVVVEVANGAIRQLSFEALDVVRSRSVTIEDAGDVQRTELLRRALDRARELRRENAGRALLLEVRLRGRTSSLEALSAWLLSELRMRTEDWNPFVWWTLGDHPATEAVRPSGTGQDEIAALLLDCSKALLGAALPRSSFLARELQPLRRVWDSEIGLEEAKSLIREATSLAIEELQERPFE